MGKNNLKIIKCGKIPKKSNLEGEILLSTFGKLKS